MPEHTKDDIVNAVKTNECKNLDGLPVHLMTKKQITEHLKRVNCPCLKKLLQEQLEKKL